MTPPFPRIVLALLVLPVLMAGCQTPPPAPLPQMVLPSDPLILYTGRFDDRNPERLAFAFSGTSIRANFRGTGIDVILAGSDDRNFYDVGVDGRTLVVQTVDGTKSFAVARGLSSGVHSVEVIKRTETSPGAFLGFRLDPGMALEPITAVSPRLIEYYGDSLTTGYGNEIAVDDPSDRHFTPRNEDISKSYAAVAARALKARYVAVCASGRGLFRNYDGNEAGTLAAYADRIEPLNPDAPLWTFQGYRPDVVVINLGSNDYISEQFRRDLGPEAFDETFSGHYRDFVARLRQVYGPQTRIVCTVGGILSDYYPAGTQALSRIGAVVRSLVQDLNSRGDPQISWMQFETIHGPFGEDYHPSAQAHQVMAQELGKAIQRATGW